MINTFSELKFFNFFNLHPIFYFTFLLFLIMIFIVTYMHRKRFVITQPTHINNSDNIDNKNASKSLDLILKQFIKTLETSYTQLCFQPRYSVSPSDTIIGAGVSLQNIDPLNKTVPQHLNSHPLFIYAFDCYIFNQLCYTIYQNKDNKCFDNLLISVNVSDETALHSDFLSYYIDIKNKYKIPDYIIELNFEEFTIFNRYPFSGTLVDNLHKNGFKCAVKNLNIDNPPLDILSNIHLDFAGISSSYFNITSDNNNAKAVLLSISLLCNTIGINLEIKDITAPEQLLSAKTLGYNIFQGNLYSAPLTIGKFINYISKFHSFSSELTQSKKQISIPTAEIEELPAKYELLLNFNKCIVIDLDIDNDWFDIISFGDRQWNYSYTCGEYSAHYHNLVSEYANLKDKFEVINFCSLQNIILEFCKGINHITKEFKGTIHTASSSQPQWYSVDIYRIPTKDQTLFKALMLIQNITDKKETEHKLKSAQLHLDMAIDLLDGIIYALDINEYTILFLNNREQFACDTLADENFFNNIEKYSKAYVYPSDYTLFMDFHSCNNILSFLESPDKSINLEYRKISPDKEYVWRSVTFMKNKDDKNILLILCKDITAQKELTHKLDNYRRRLYSFIELTYVSVFEIDLLSNSHYVILPSYIYDNDHPELTYSQLLDYMSATDVIHHDDQYKLYTTISRKNLLDYFRRTQKPLSLDYRVLVNSVYIWHRMTISKEPDTEYMIIGYISDIDRQKRDKTAVAPQPMLDPLTQLYNFNTITELSDGYIFNQAPNDSHMVVLLDIDNFTEFNNRYSKIVGDMILCDIANQLKHTIGYDDILGRIGGDEFYILFKNTTNNHGGINKLNSIKSIFSSGINTPYRNITACIGAAFYPEHGDIPTTVYRSAEIALQQSKEKGFGICTIYTHTSDIQYHSVVNHHIDYDTDFHFDQSLIDKIFMLIYNTTDINVTIPVILGFIGHHFNVNRVFIFEANETTGALKNTFEWCSQGSPQLINDMPELQLNALILDGKEYSQLFNLQDIFRIDNTAHLSPDIKKYIKSRGVKSCVQCAIRENDKFKGFIGFEQLDNERIWNNSEIHTLLFISRLLSIFLLKNRAKEDLIAEKNISSNMINNSSGYSYIVDPDTYELLYLSPQFTKLFPLLRLGDVCHRAMFSFASPCPTCSVNKCLKNNKSIHKRISTVHFDTDCYLTLNPIQWFDGRKVVLIILSFPPTQ